MMWPLGHVAPAVRVAPNVANLHRALGAYCARVGPISARTRHRTRHRGIKGRRRGDRNSQGADTHGQRRGAD